MRLRNQYYYFFLLVVFLFACKDRKQGEQGPALFDALDNKATGLDFANKLTPAPDFNMFKYMYFYNGGGVGAGDFNNDGLIDLFFSANQTDNKLYINSDSLHFKDVTAQAKIPQDHGWSTGVSVVDINNDGMLDIYVCKVGKYENLSGRNQLLICEGIDKNGIPMYADKAVQYGLDFSGFSTQAAFLDYDSDGDLDMYLMNHSLRFNGTFSSRASYEGTNDPLAGDRIYRNDGNVFTDVTAATGISSTVISYGLGICVSDIDLDGYPDLYIGNDFHENDYLYINQRNGTFRDMLTERTMHISQFSMGVDVADANNDGQPEIISMDMLPYDPYILRRSLGEDAYDVFNYKVRYGYQPQYARNNLQFNRGNGMFSELGMYAGVHATDWSWAPLWMDFDNDGLKDLFVTNGIPKRLNDIDYVNYVSNGEIQDRIRANRIEESDMALIEKFPQIKLPNQFFKNEGQLVFKELGANVGANPKTYSNGAVYADFDNDGDLDIVVNNIDEPAVLYRNNAAQLKPASSTELILKGDEKNRNATGAKLVVFKGDEIRTYEKFPVRGFQSSMEVPMHVGLGGGVDSMVLIWPDNTCEPVPVSSARATTLIYRKGLPRFDYKRLKPKQDVVATTFRDHTSDVKLFYQHKENRFVEFDREPLIPRMVSTEGPALAVMDMNKDGLDDVFIGSSKGEKSALFIQTRNGKFARSIQPALDMDSTYEDVDACWADVNKDGYIDLIVSSGGNEYYGEEPYLLPRVYLNDKSNMLTRKQDAFEGMYMTASCVEAYDFNKDGYEDLFVGGRAVPWEYGEKPRSYLLQNDGQGRFKDVTDAYAKDLANIGFVKDGKWIDIDKDGDSDLLLAMEWDGIYAFINDKGHFTKKALTTKKGWWNFITPGDIDDDGDLDLIAGNFGLNSRLKASENEPVRLYYNDFDNNGKREQILTYYLQGKEIPFATKAELEKQIPILKKRFLYAEDFAKATLTDLFSKEKLDKSIQLSADYFANAVLINKGNLEFVVQPLPWQAQLTSYNDCIVGGHLGYDNLPDIFLGGNFYQNNIQMGMQDADYGTVLTNKSLKDSAMFVPLAELPIKGQIRHIARVNIARKMVMFIIARNNDSVKVVRF